MKRRFAVALSVYLAGVTGAWAQRSPRTAAVERPTTAHDAGQARRAEYRRSWRGLALKLESAQDRAPAALSDSLRVQSEAAWAGGIWGRSALAHEATTAAERVSGASPAGSSERISFTQSWRPAGLGLNWSLNRRRRRQAARPSRDDQTIAASLDLGERALGARLAWISSGVLGSPADARSREARASLLRAGSRASAGVSASWIERPGARGNRTLRAIEPAVSTALGGGWRLSLKYRVQEGAAPGGAKSSAIGEAAWSGRAAALVIGWQAAPDDLRLTLRCRLSLPSFWTAKPSAGSRARLLLAGRRAGP